MWKNMPRQIISAILKLVSIIGKLVTWRRQSNSFVKAYEMHDPMMPYITLSEIGFDDIKDDPRIISIVEEMNLPFEAPD